MIPQLGPRYLLGRRVHHGLVGVVLAAIGVVLAWDDRHDFPWQLSRRRR